MMNILVHATLLLVLPPFLLGVINRTKAFFGGRKGPPLLQPYRDLARLLKKGLVLSTTTTLIFRAAPLVTLVAVLFAGLLMPLGPFDAPVHFVGDLVLFAYLFGLARFFTTAAALDTGSSFEGMGAAREVTFACLSEPALFFALLLLAKMSGSLDLSDMLHSPLHARWTILGPSLVLVGVGLFIVVLAENCRIPVDDPNTHLELTMIHEVMVLDHSGPLLGIIQYAAAMKLFVLGAFLLHVIAPFQTGRPWLDWGLFCAELVGLSVAIGVVESIMARLQMKHVPTLLVASILFCAFGYFLLVR
jgi:formate hydrogenlyase subunit 4